MSSNLHSIPVVFFDRYYSHNLGCINVTIPMSFVSLQTIISRSLRVRLQEFGIWLMHPAEVGATARYSAEPVGKMTDLSAAARASGKDCYFLAAPRSSHLEGSTSRELRMGIWDYERMVAAAATTGSTMGVRTQLKAPWMNVSSTNAPVARCAECEVARRVGKTPKFHHCVNDRAKVGFELRPAAGPIARPRKKM